MDRKHTPVTIPAQLERMSAGEAGGISAFLQTLQFPLASPFPR